MKEKLDIQDYQRYYKFTVIRNTFDRIASFYRMYENSGYIIKEFCKQNQINNFKDFVMNIDFIIQTSKTNQKLQRNIEPISDWICIDGRNQMDEIYYLNELNDNWIKICQKIKINYSPITHLQPMGVKNTNINYRSLYDVEMKNKIELVYGEEIEAFKFTYE